MSKYTTELRFICETYAGLTESEGYHSIKEIIDKSWDKVFDFDFPIFDEAYRKVLCSRIIRHFYTREICAETVGRWKLFLEDKMDLIMDKYNLLYKSFVEGFNPLYDVDYSHTYTKKNDGTQNNNGKTNIATTGDSSSDNTNSQTANNSTTGNSTSKFSDTPQGALTGIANNSYLTNATIGDTSGTSNTSTSGSANTKNKSIEIESGTSENKIDVDNLEQYTSRVFGKKKAGYYSEMIRDFAENMDEVDDMIIMELEPLFMSIY